MNIYRVSDSGTEEIAEDVESVNLKQVEEKIEEILFKLKIETPILANMKQQQRVMQKLEIVKCSVSVKDTIKEVKDLTSTLKELFKVEEDSVPDENANALVTVDILRECKSIDDIEIKAAEFKYREETGSMVCLVCDSKFAYSSDEMTSFQD